MLKKFLLLILFVGYLFLVAGSVLADETDPDADYPWRSHAEPFAFTFGNKIDSHQQSRIVDGGKLRGFLYIHDTGDRTTEGLPVAEPAKCPHMEDCRVGWILKGVPITAILVNKSPRVWLVDPADLPNEPGYNHFHWLGEPRTPHDLEIGRAYSGMLLKRIAAEPFFWLGGGSDGMGGPGGSGGHGGRIVPEGVDPHTNIVTNWDGSSTGGGSCDGHDGGDTGGCSGDSGDTGGCSGDSGDAGGCSGDSGDTGGCSGDSGDTGGCTGHDSGDTGSDPGGCSGTDDGSCSG